MSTLDMQRDSYGGHAIIQKLLAQETLQSLLPLLAELPYDSSASVQALYECLHDCCRQILPDACWRVELLSTGLFLVNQPSRWLHTQLVRQLLFVFRTVVLHHTPD